HQHFMLADYLTVLENVVLGSEKLFGIGDRAGRRRVRIVDASGGVRRVDARPGKISSRRMTSISLHTGKVGGERGVVVMRATPWRRPGRCTT
ncbi:hypothetical protein ABZT10_40210, partial [Streptomyces sp900116325]